ncbi:alpha/beta fold hydrolase [Granulicoccus sp. GXG6511]|uniref:alpha/beta fold hydrolase n=1 Tax=Granulicoccus sp. GXG6511 TaxID=3381351 RepID=UPI003D7D5D12
MGAAHDIPLTGSQGAELATRLDLPAGPPKAIALLAHCLNGSDDHYAVSRIAAGLNELGIGVLRLDLTDRALGSSMSAEDFSTACEDARLAIGWLTEHVQSPQLLIGHSLGGAAVLSVAEEFADVRAVATIGAPSDPSDVVTDAAARLRRALLVMHSPIDNVVGVEHAIEIFAAARNPKSYVSLDPADHFLTKRGDAEFAARMIGTWAERYIVEPESFAAPDPSAQVVVGETGQGTFLNHVVAGRHHALADEPESVGGFDAGMSPYDYLAAALGACTSMTIRMYAQHKKLPLDRVVVEVEHDKVYSDDSDAASTGAKRKIDQFTRTLHLTGDLDPAVRQRMAEIADRCPVHRTLHESSRIVTTLADS